MNRQIAAAAMLLGGAIAFALLSRGPRRRLARAVGRQMRERMEHMMASLPENSPPKLVMSVLPRLHSQNDEIIRMLREQNALLREHLSRS